MNKTKGFALFVAILLLMAGCGEASYMQTVAQEDDALRSEGNGPDGEDALLSEDAGQTGDDDSRSKNAGQAGVDPSPTEGAASKAPYYVQVAGAVAKPGVYELAPGSRIFEAIALAGGMTAEADDADLNQAMPVEDGQKIYVRTHEEQEALRDGQASVGGGGDMPSEDDGRISINLASEAELATLPGIGQTKAAKIVEYRSRHGSFSSIEDIMQVEGIKQGTYQKFCDNIKL